MAVSLVAVAGKPGAGYLFPGRWHYIAHFLTFAVFGAVWTLGLPKASPLHVAAGAVAFGFMHEAYEIAGHVHGFELVDAIVDAMGAIVGISFAHLCLRGTTPGG